MIDRHGLSVAPALVRFLEERALPGSGVDTDHFWAGMADVLARFAAENAALLARRDALQTRIDDWYRAGGAQDGGVQRAFLTEIGYLTPEPEPFTIAPGSVDDEVARLAGPQLVVPMLNDRHLSDDAYLQRLLALPAATAVSAALPPPAAAWAQASCKIAITPGVYPSAHVLPATYIATYRPIAETQLRIAGDRLAAILNAALAGP